MQRPAKSVPQSKGRIRPRRPLLLVEPLESRFYPGGIIDALSWTALGSGLPFLVWDRLAQALGGSRMTALPADPAKSAAGRLAAVADDAGRGDTFQALRSFLAPPAAVDTSASTAAGTAGHSFSFELHSATNHSLSDPLSDTELDPFASEIGSTDGAARRHVRNLMDDEDNGDRDLRRRAADGLAPAFVPHGNVADTNPPSPYVPAEHARDYGALSYLGGGLPQNQAPEAPPPTATITLQMYNQTPATEASSIGWRLLASFTADQGVSTDYAAQVIWGDNTTPDDSTDLPTPNVRIQPDTTTCGGKVYGQHTYSEDGVYRITVTARNTTMVGGSSAKDTSILVQDAPLLGIPKTLQGDAFQESKKIGNLAVADDFVVVASFTDPKSGTFPSEYSAIIDWGNGNVTHGRVVANSTIGGFDVQGGFESSLPNIYYQEGTYAITVTVREIDGSILTIKSTAIIGDIPLVPFTGSVGFCLPGDGSPPPVFSGTVATFDEGIFDLPSEFSATIDWGDGGTSAGTIIEPRRSHFSGLGGAWVGPNNADSVFTVKGTHPYPRSQTGFIGHVTITDVDGNQRTIDFNTGSPEFCSGTNIPDRNVAVTVSTVTVKEGSEFNGTVATFTDTATPQRTSYDYIIDWGDNGPGPYSDCIVGSPGPQGSPIVNRHLYSEDGTYTVTVSVYPHDPLSYCAGAFGSYATGTGQANIGEEPVIDASLTATKGPSLYVARTENVNEGQLVGSSTNPITLMTFVSSNLNAMPSDFTAWVAWGDDPPFYQLDPVPAMVVRHTGDAGGFDIIYASQNGHTYADEGSYPLRIEIAQNLQGFAESLGTLMFYGTATVYDAPLMVSGVSGLSAQAGQALPNVPVANFTDPTVDDPSYYSATIFWGDGTSSSGSVTGFGQMHQVLPGSSHAYSRPGIYTANVLVTETHPQIPIPPFRWNPFAQGQATSTITITGAGGTPPVTALQLTATEGKPIPPVPPDQLPILATFPDPGPNYTNLQASITWGDGAPDSNATLDRIGGTYNIRATHVYTEDRSFLLSVTLTYIYQQTPGSSSGYSTVTVVEGSLESVSGTNLVSMLGIPLRNAVLATFKDPHPDLASNYSALIQWGDDTRVRTGGRVYSGLNGQYYVVASQPIVDPQNPPYAASGTYTVLVSIFDSDGRDADANPVYRTQVTSTVTVSQAGVGLLSTPLVAVFNNRHKTTFDVGAIPIGWGDGTPPWRNYAPYGPMFQSLGGATPMSATQAVYGAHIYTRQPRRNARTFAARATYFDDGLDSPVSNGGLPYGLLVTPAWPYFRAAALFVLGTANQELGSMGTDSRLTGSVALATFSTVDAIAKPDQFTATVFWGDNQQSQGEVVRNAGGTFTVYGSHTYTISGRNIPITILLKNSRNDGIQTITSTVANIEGDLTIHQRFPGTRLEVGTDASADGGQITVAPNTGALQVYQPLDFRFSHDAALHGFIDFDGNPLQGMISGDGRHFNDGAMVSPGIRGFNSLVYSSDTVSVRPIGEATVPSDPAKGIVNSIRMQLTWNGSLVQDTNYMVTSDHQPGDTYLVGGQVPAGTVTATGVYPWSIQATVNYASGQTDMPRPFSGNALVVVNEQSQFGAGWTLAGVNQLFIANTGVMMIYGSGAAPRFFSNFATCPPIPPDTTHFNSPPDDFGTLTRTGAYTYDYVSKYGVRWSFDATNTPGHQTALLQTITDPHNLAVAFSYSGTNLTLIAYPDGGTTNFSGNTIQEPGGRSLTLGIAGDLSSITDADGTMRSFSYDGQHRLTGLQWAPTRATFSYDPSYGVLRTVDRGSGTTYALRPTNIVALQSPASQPSDAVATLVNGRTVTNTYMTDYLGWLTALTRPVQSNPPASINETWGRDASEQVTDYIDGLYRTTHYQYGLPNNNTPNGPQTGSGDLRQASYPDGGSDSFQYDSLFHRRTSYQDGNSNLTAYQYNSTADVVKIIDANNQVTTQLWSSDGRALLTSVIDRRGNATNYQFYPAPSRLLQLKTDAQQPTPGQTTYTYDSAGFPYTMQDARLNYTTQQNDLRGRLTQQTVADGGITTLVYDAIGHLTRRTDPGTNNTTNTTIYQYDGRGWQTGVQDALTHQAITLYDAAGNVTSSTDTNNHTGTYAYDLANRRTEMTDAESNITTYLLDAAGNMTGMIDANRHLWQYDYDGRDRRTVVLDPLLNQSSTDYDLAGNVTSVQDANFNPTQYSYDALNRRTVTVDALKNARTTLYDAEGNVTSVAGPLNRLTTYSYDNVNRPIERTESADPTATATRRTTTTLYDLVGNLSVTISPRQVNGQNLRTSYSYDPVNRRTGMVDALGQPSQTLYEKAGNITATIDELGRMTTFSYDALNRRTEVTESAAATATMTRRTTTTLYDAVGNVTGVLVPQVDGLNNLSSFVYDRINRLTLTIDTLSQRVTTMYDGVGNVTSVQDEARRLATFSYDAANRRTETTEAAGTSLARVSTTLYDAAGNVAGTKMPGVNAADVRLTSSAYDALNRRTEVTEGAHLAVARTDRRTTKTGYDALGNTTAVTDPVGNQTLYLYDALDRRSVTVDPLQKRTTVLYDAADNVTQITDRNSRVRQFLYDALNRRTNEVWQTTPLTTFTYLYDAASQLTGANDPYSNYSFTPDALGRVTAISNANTPRAPLVVLSQNFDALDRRRGIAAALSSGGDSARIYDYDALGRMTQVISSTVGGAYKHVTFDYQPDNQFARVARYAAIGTTNPVATTVYNTYDDLARLRQMTHQPQASSPIAYTWDFDAGDRLTQMTNGEGASTYLYDAVDQLTAGSYSFSQPRETYVYDRNGNRQQAGTSTYGTAVNDRIPSDGVYTYSYDNEGNRTGRTLVGTPYSTQYNWDYRNRLTSVIDNSSFGQATYTFTYDIFDRRIAKGVQSGSTQYTTQYVYDGSQILLAFTGATSAATVAHRYLWGPAPDQLLADEKMTGSTITNLWPLTDHLGTVRDYVNDSGMLQTALHVRYDGFGRITSSQPADDFFAYTGQYWDHETQLYNYKGRYYDSYTGSFISEDPIGFAAGDANLYRYVGNNAVGDTDPSGLGPGIPVPPASSAEHQIATILNDVIAEMRIEGWKPPPTKSGIPNTGAFGDEVERRIGLKLDAWNQANKSGYFSSKPKWYTNVWLDENGTIIAIGERPKLRNTASHTQIDVLRAEKGYTPKIGETLNGPRVNIFDVKSAADFRVRGRQEKKLIWAANLQNTGKARGFRTLISPAVYDFRAKTIVVNPTYASRFNFYTKAIKVGGAIATIIAVIRYSDFDDEFEVLLQRYEEAKRAARRGFPDEINSANVGLLEATKRYFSNFADADIGTILAYLKTVDLAR